MMHIEIFTGPGYGYCDRAKALFVLDGVHVDNRHAMTNPEALDRIAEMKELFA